MHFIISSQEEPSPKRHGFVCKYLISLLSSSTFHKSLEHKHNVIKFFASLWQEWPSFQVPTACCSFSSETWSDTSLLFLLLPVSYLGFHEHCLRSLRVSPLDSPLKICSWKCRLFIPSHQNSSSLYSLPSSKAASTFLGICYSSIPLLRTNFCFSSFELL